MLFAALVLSGLSLRTTFASLPPLLHEVRADLRLSAGVAGLLTTGPVICFGLFATAAPALARRWPIEWTLATAALITAAATAVRGTGVIGLFAGTVFAGVAVAISQTLVPILVRVRFRERAALLTGALSMTLTLGAALAAGLAVPLEHVFGGWRSALAGFALPAFVASAIWLIPAGERPTQLDRVARAPLHRLPGSWSLAALFGLQAMAFYSGLTWLPSILESRGFSDSGAGGLLALANAVQFVPAFAASMLAGRARHQTGLLVSLATLSCIAIAGLLIWTPGAPLWMVVLGIGQGGSLGLGLILPTLRGASAEGVASLTAMMLAIGYGLASLGPFVTGVMHDITGRWIASLMFMLVITALEVPLGWQSTRPWRAG